MPPGRSKSANKAPNRDVSARILEEATRLFAARGFDGVSLQAIADEVGVRKQSVLYHFPTKDDLRRSVLDQMLSHWNEVLPRLLMAATSGTAQFDLVVETTLSFFTDDPDRARLLVREVLDRPEEMRRLIEAYVHPWATVVCDYIRKGQAQGRIRQDVDPEAYLAHVINIIVSGIATYECIGAIDPRATGRGSDRARYVSELLRIAKSSLFRPEAMQPSDATHDESSEQHAG